MIRFIIAIMLVALFGAAGWALAYVMHERQERAAGQWLRSEIGKVPGHLKAELLALACGPCNSHAGTVTCICGQACDSAACKHAEALP